MNLSVPQAGDVNYRMDQPSSAFSIGPLSACPYIYQHGSLLKGAGHYVLIRRTGTAYSEAAYQSKP